MAYVYTREHSAKSLIDADRTFDAGTISVAIVDIMKIDRKFTFADAEAILREYNSNTYLVAVPKLHAPPGLYVLGTDHAPRDFFMWVCLHGYEEATQKLRAVGVRSFDENIENLRVTGFLTRR